MWWRVLLLILLTVAAGTSVFAQKAENVPGTLGLTVKDLEAEDKLEGPGYGVKVEGIDENGPARKPGHVDIARGDLIIAANGKPVTDVRSFTSIVSDFFAYSPVRLVRLRRNEIREVVIILA